MDKEKLGTKQTCPNCGAKFYDLTREPAECPKCEHSFVPEQPMPRSRGGSRQSANGAAQAAKAAQAAQDQEKPAAAEAPKKAEEAEPVVTFEEADAEASDVKRSGTPATDDDANIEVEGEVEVEADQSDNAGLLADDDDFEDDVSGIIDTDINKES